MEAAQGTSRFLRISKAIDHIAVAQGILHQEGGKTQRGQALQTKEGKEGRKGTHHLNLRFGLA